MEQVGGNDHVGRGKCHGGHLSSNWLGGRLSVCSRCKAGTCVPPQGKGRAHHSNRKGNGQRRPDGEHNVVDAFLTGGELPGTRFQSEEIQIG